MKIRNHRNKEWWFFPPENSKINKGKWYRFKFKSDLMKFLTANLAESVNGEVRIEESCFGYSGCLRMFSVWYNDKECKSGAKVKADLRQMDFRGRKFVHKQHKIEKDSKKYFAFSDKVIRLMCNIQDDNGIILSKDAKRLVELFKKRGFKDFEPNEEDWQYIDGHISNGIDFYHWSDRCNWLRTKTIIEYFNRSGLLSSI